MSTRPTRLDLIRQLVHLRVPARIARVLVEGLTADTGLFRSAADARREVVRELVRWGHDDATIIDLCTDARYRLAFPADDVEALRALIAAVRAQLAPPPPPPAPPRPATRLVALAKDAVVGRRDRPPYLVATEGGRRMSWSLYSGAARA